MAKLGINESEFAVTTAPTQASTAASQPSTPAHVETQPATTHPKNPAASSKQQQQARHVDPGMREGSDPVSTGSKAAGNLGTNSKAAVPSIVRGVVRNETAEEGGEEEGEEDEDEWARGFLDLADLSAAATAAAAPAPTAAPAPAATAAAAAAEITPSMQSAAVEEPPISLSSIPSSGQEDTASDEPSPGVVASPSAPGSNAEDVSMTEPTDLTQPSQLCSSPCTLSDSKAAAKADAAPESGFTTLEPESNAASSTASTANDDEPPAWDLFDSTAAEPPLPPGAAPATAAAAAAAASRNASALRRLLKVAASKGGGRPPPPSEPPKVPRTFLSQHCQRVSWPQPRFERLPDVGAEGGFRYSAILDLGPSR